MRASTLRVDYFWKRGEIRRDELLPGVGMHAALRGVEEPQRMLGHELRMHVAEGVGVFDWMSFGIGAHGGGDEMQERVGGRLVVAAGWVLGDVVARVICLDAGAHSPQRFVEGMSREIGVGDAHVGAVGPLIERKGERFELAEKLAVVHFDR